MTLLNVFSDAKIGPYTEKNFIDNGGMSKVYRVDDDNVDKVNRNVNFVTQIDEDKKGINDTIPLGIFNPIECLHINLKKSDLKYLSKAKKVEYKGHGWMKFDKREIDLGSKFLLHACSEYNVLRTLKNFENVVQISDDLEGPIFALDSKRNFVSIIRMNYVKGDSLHFLGENDYLTIEDIAQIMIDMCNVLENFKPYGIIHRDIKPGNIISHVENGERKNTLIDFGLAMTLDKPKYLAKDLQKLLDERIEPDEGHVLGTPSYMSPEVIKGESVSFSSDAFALGSTFFHLLARETAFPGEEVKQIIVKIGTYSKEKDRLDLMDRLHNNFSKEDSNRKILADGIECLLHENPEFRDPVYTRERAKKYLEKKFSRS